MPCIEKIQKTKDREARETENTKQCTVCGKIKPLFEFHVNKHKRKFADSWCSACSAANTRERLYGITSKEYDELLKSQDGKCAICKTIIPGGRGTFHIDHDHTIKNKKESVRGLLCHDCNTALGKFRDDPEILTAAAGYLLKWRAKKEKKVYTKTGEKNEKN